MSPVDYGASVAGKALEGLAEVLRPKDKGRGAHGQRSSDTVGACNVLGPATTRLKVNSVQLPDEASMSSLVEDSPLVVGQDHERYC